MLQCDFECALPVKHGSDRWRHHPKKMNVLGVTAITLFLCLPLGTSSSTLQTLSMAVANKTVTNSTLNLTEALQGDVVCELHDDHKDGANQLEVLLRCDWEAKEHRGLLIASMPARIDWEQHGQMCTCNSSYIDGPSFSSHFIVRFETSPKLVNGSLKSTTIEAITGDEVTIEFRIFSFPPLMLYKLNKTSGELGVDKTMNLTVEPMTEEGGYYYSVTISVPKVKTVHDGLYIAQFRNAAGEDSTARFAIRVVNNPGGAKQETGNHTKTKYAVAIVGGILTLAIVVGLSTLVAIKRRNSKDEIGRESAKVENAKTQEQAHGVESSHNKWDIARIKMKLTPREDYTIHDIANILKRFNSVAVVTHGLPQDDNPEEDSARVRGSLVERPSQQEKK